MVRNDLCTLPPQVSAQNLVHVVSHIEHFCTIFCRLKYICSHSLGSFGTYPKDVRRAYRVYQDIAEAAPDRFMRYESIPLLDTARAEIATYLSAPTSEIVFVQNASTGINTILRNLTYSSTDVILYFDTLYPACEKTLLSLLESLPEAFRPQLRKIGHGQRAGFSLPCTHSDILNSFSQTISRCIYDNLTVRLALFDTISSLPGVRFPFERLVTMCREYNILSCIDGAHGVGHIPLNLSELDADFFVSNCHKWLYTPRGCAVLHVPERNQKLIRTTIPTSHGFVPLPDPNSNGTVMRNPLAKVKSKTPFEALFQFVATVDSSAYYCIPQALKFRREVCGGEENIMRYIREIAQRGADIMARVLETSVLDDEDVAERGTFLRVGSGSWGNGRVEGGAGRVRSGTLNLGEKGGLRGCALANVLLPIAIVDADIEEPEGDEEVWDIKIVRNNSQSRLLSAEPGKFGGAEIRVAEVREMRDWFEERLVKEFNTFVAIFEYRGRMWCRVSGQVYLELRDFEWLGAVLKGLCARVGRGEWRANWSRRASGTVHSRKSSAAGLGAGLGKMIVAETPVDDQPQWQAEYWSHA
jgi:selenocysteine lyase/cysteine desulfurase